MTGESVELADVVRQYGGAYLERYARCTPWHQQRVLLDIARCRTAAMGGHVDVCTECGLLRCAYNSCRNRHCPKCLGSARWRWTHEREAELLPVPYFHVVFTLPQELAPLALGNQRVVYGLLFKAAAQTLSEVAADPKHLGAKIGFLAVLHTWGQKLNHHPHVHCVVPGGGLSPDGGRWISARPNFFLHVKVLGGVFRGKFLDLLYQAFAAGQISCSGKLAPLRSRSSFKRLLARAKHHDWVVYSKPPFGSPAQVVRYLARYTHRVAIANYRILALANGLVTFSYKDYADNNRIKVMSLPALVFIRRFLMHVLPSGFTRIRYYGLMSNRYRSRHLALCRQRIAEAAISPTPLLVMPTEESGDVPDPIDPQRCPACHSLSMRTLRTYARPFLAPEILAQPVLAWDTS